MLNTFSFGLIAIFLAVLLPLKVMEKAGNNKLKISACLTSVALFMIVALPTFDGDAGTIAFLTDKIGTGGMLTSVVTGVFTAWIFNVASKHSLFKKDTIMPDMVVNWIDALIPVTIVLVVGLVIYNIGFDLPLVIRSIFSPIEKIGQTWYGVVLVSFLTCFPVFLRFTWILFPIAWAIWMTGMDANMAAVAAGQAATNINLMETLMGITYIGGQGATLTLVILCMRSKCKRLKAIGDVTIFPAIFNINEPIVFGAPVVWNPILMIPVVAELYDYSAHYVCNHADWPGSDSGSSHADVVPSDHYPGPFGNRSFSGVILVIILTVVSYFIWLPFFRVYEKSQIEEEEREELEKKAA